MTEPHDPEGGEPPSPSRAIGAPIAAEYQAAAQAFSAWAELRQLQAQAQALQTAIEAHNAACVQACEGADAALCGAFRRVGKRCPQCPRAWMIVAAAPAKPARDGS